MGYDVLTPQKQQTRLRGAMVMLWGAEGEDDSAVAAFNRLSGAAVSAMGYDVPSLGVQVQEDPMRDDTARRRVRSPEVLPCAFDQVTASPARTRTPGTNIS